MNLTTSITLNRNIELSRLKEKIFIQKHEYEKVIFSSKNLTFLNNILYF